jgi:dihydroorotate dehydrogenase subfamily 1
MSQQPASVHNPLALDFLGLKFSSPIVLLSGCVGFGEEFTRVAGFSNRDAGAVVLKGTTLAPRLGNPPHRVFETPMGMLNAIGLQNPGAEYVVGRILPTLDFSETRFIANACGSTIEEYAEVTRRFDDSPIDAIEINISCPNVKEGGVAFGNYPDMSARVVAACRAITRKPLITKLSPNQTDIRENARRCIEAGSDALAVINTFSGMAIDVRTRRPVIGNIQAGLSRSSRCTRFTRSPHPCEFPSLARGASRRPMMPSSSWWRAPPPWESARRFFTIPWCARRSMRGSQTICASTASRASAPWWDRCRSVRTRRTRRSPVELAPRSPDPRLACGLMPVRNESLAGRPLKTPC